MVEERMKTALQSKLPEPPDGFGERNDQLISSLMSGREKQYASREKHRILVPAIVIAIMMMLGIGIAASNGHWGVFNWLSENRSQEINTDQPFMIEGETPFLPPVDTDHVTITVREAQSDGYGLYLSVVFTPKEKDALAFNWGINPFQDGPVSCVLEKRKCGSRTLYLFFYRAFKRSVLRFFERLHDRCSNRLIQRVVV